MEKNNRLGVVSARLNSSFNVDIQSSPDKSISHRALIISAISDNSCKISNLLESDDVFRTLEALRLLGVHIHKDNNLWIVKGVSRKGLHTPETSIYLGNSGTSLRLLIGLTSVYNFNVEFTGDRSLSNRSSKELVQMLEKYVCKLQHNQFKLPVKINAFKYLTPILHEEDNPSAQLKGAFLLSSMNIPGKHVYKFKSTTRTHTEDLLQYFGCKIDISKDSIELLGEQNLTSKDIIIPGDPSSAAYLIAIAILNPNSNIIIRDICVNKSRIKFIEILKNAGAKIAITNEKSIGYDVKGDIEVSSSELSPLFTNKEDYPLLVDEYPILSIIASKIPGKSIFNGLSGLRNKECDRLNAIYTNLNKCGVNAKVIDDNLEILGNSDINGGICIDSDGDHRIAMSFIILGLFTKDRVWAKTNDMIKTSYPNFTRDLKRLGINITNILAN